MTKFREELRVGNQTGEPPKEGAFRRDRKGSKNNRTGTTKSGQIVGKITKKLWDNLTGWGNPGR